ncbi:hypothetical protein [Brevibacillus centrosporus]|uniref:hypothetical protein n=1 Tax=Brevibacillus centrosporus TaxID=54910 RepID=UPI003987DED7
MKEMMFETREGHRLIGISVEPTNEQKVRVIGAQMQLGMGAFDAVFIHRTRLNRVTVLDKEEILRIRLVTVFDTEYDPHLGVGE